MTEHSEPSIQPPWPKRTKKRVNLLTLTPEERFEVLTGRKPEDGEVEMALDLNLV